jgi:hypothetical protein
MKESGLRKYDKETINLAFSKVNNYFELTHCIINIEITSQYILLILSILNLEKHPTLAYTKFS